MPVTKYYPFTSGTTNLAFLSASEQSAVLPSGTLNTNPVERWAELSTAKPVGAVALASGGFSSLGQTAAQSALLGTGYYQLGSGTVASGTWRIAVNSVVEANANANAFLAASIYVWRPATSTVVGRVYDATTALGAEFGTTATTRLASITGSAVTCQNGDYLVFELWYTASQAATTAYSITVLLDNQNGRTDVSTTGATPTGLGGFIESPDTLPVYDNTVDGSGQALLSLGVVATDRFTSTITPDGTVSASNWTTVSAATVHEALAAGDTDYIEAAAAGATTRVTLSNPANLYASIAAATLRIRARGP